MARHEVAPQVAVMAKYRAVTQAAVIAKHGAALRATMVARHEAASQVAMAARHGAASQAATAVTTRQGDNSTCMMSKIQKILPTPENSLSLKIGPVPAKHTPLSSIWKWAKSHSKGPI